MLIMVLKGGEDPLCFVCLLVLSWHRNYSFSYIASLSLLECALLSRSRVKIIFSFSFLAWKESFDGNAVFKY